MYDYQKHLTPPPEPFGGYSSETISKDELEKIINKQLDSCMEILFGDDSEYRYDNCLKDCKK